MIAPIIVCAWWYTAVVSIMGDFPAPWKDFQANSWRVTSIQEPFASKLAAKHMDFTLLSRSIFSPSKVGMVKTPHQRCQSCFCVEGSGLNCGIQVRAWTLTMQQRYPNASSTPALETERLNRTLRCYELMTLTQAQVPSFSCTSVSSVTLSRSPALPC